MPAPPMPNGTTEMRPVRLAQELGISPKTLRAFLRRKFPRDPADHGTGWTLTSEQVAAARRNFSSRVVMKPTGIKVAQETLPVSRTPLSAGKTPLPCYVRPGLDVLFVALNPPTQSANNRHWFSGEQSAFFKLLHLSGLITKSVPKATADEIVFGGTSVNFKSARYGVTDLRPDLVEVNSGKVALKDAHVEAFMKCVRENEPRLVCIIHSRVWNAFNGLLGSSADVIDVAAVGKFTQPLAGCPSRFICNYFPNGNGISDKVKIDIFTLLRVAI